MSLPNSLESFWMPFTANQAFKDNPRMLVAADRMHYTSSDGRSILDGTAGLWCVNAGHNHPKIRAAVQEQVGELDYAPCFQFGHPKAFELANRVTAMFPEGMDHIFFANSGSEAVDSALKIALAYHAARGDGGRTRLIGRERGYHGTGFGGISVGGIVNNRMRFGALLSGVDHMRHTHDLARNAFSPGCPEHGAELADDLERLVALHGPGTIAAVIVEPLAGSAGVLLPPEGYLQRLREACDRHGVLLIFDEVITAFGRLGAPTASDYFGVTPDIITCAKGLTSGVIPMGGVVVKDEIYETIVNATHYGIELFHGYTYSGHPIAVAAIDAYESDRMFQNAAELSTAWRDALHSLRDCPHVIDIRTLGLVGAIELTPRDGAPGRRAFDAMQAAFDQGMMIRITADIIALSPPLIISREQIDEIADRLRAVLSTLH